ncbi:YceD family protein [soil metagenome]
MTSGPPGFRILVSDLVDRPGERRSDSGSVDIDVVVGESRVEGSADVTVAFDGIDQGVLARFEASVEAELVCTRCLVEWREELSVSASQVYEQEPDDDGYALERDDTIDLGGPVRDEIALAIPLRPLCRPDCAGLCPTCGNDLNTDPCGGHVEPSTSPFAVLRDLMEDDPRERRSP